MSIITLKIEVKTNKKEFSFFKKNGTEDEYIIHTTNLPIDNKCNDEIIKELGKIFKTNNIKIKKGEKSKKKIIILEI